MMKIMKQNSSGNNLRMNGILRPRSHEMRAITEGDKTTYEVPAIILAERVLTGVNYPYPELVSRRSIIRSAEDWNDVPVVVYHPFDSAKKLEVIEAELIGRIYQPEVIEEEDSDLNSPIKLKVVVRLDESLLTKNPKGKKIIEKLEQGMVIELSTGYYLTEYVEQKGVFNGKTFMGIQLGFVPNHLAILPEDNDMGAYSVEEGAGLNRDNERNNKQGAGMKERDFLLKNGYSEEAVSAMTEPELKLTADLVKNHSEKEIDAEVKKRVNAFKENYLESDDFKEMVDNKAKEIVEAEAEKQFRDNAWKELKGKVALERNDLDEMPSKAIEVVVNAAKSVEKPLVGDSDETDEETPKGVDFEETE